MKAQYFEIENRKWKLEEVEASAWGKGVTRFELTLFEDGEFFGRWHFASKEKAMDEILSYNQISEDDYLGDALTLAECWERYVSSIGY